MRRLALVAVLGAAALGAAACGTSSAPLDANHVLVSDHDGQVDARQIKQACDSLGKQVDGWKDTGLDLSDGQVLEVTCR